MTATTAKEPEQPAKPARWFISGHSLTDLPFPNQVAEVARSLGQTLDWERQYMIGSAIRDRARGPGANSGWAGYSQGDNRAGRGLDVVAELKSKPYDVLLITEQHGLLEALVWHDAVRHLRHYHDRFIAGNPRGKTYYYEPWLGLTVDNDVKRWVAYERRAAPVWRCVVARVNRSLASQSRSDRISSIPAGLALAELVHRATEGAGLDGITATTPLETFKRLFSDDVHPTGLGFYFLALVTVANVFETSPQGAWAPQGVSPQQAATLQRLAAELAAQFKRDAAQVSTEQACKALLNASFINTYFNHRRDEYWARRDGSTWRMSLRRLKTHAMLRWQLWRRDPLAWDISDDNGAWWFAPP